MKNLVQLLSFCLLIILSSCEKEVIPEPNVIPAAINGPVLYVTGDFNGVSKTMIIDDSLYIAHSYLSEQPLDSFGYWSFDVYNSDSLFMPELAFQIFNHELSPTFDYSDLVESTDSSSIEFVNTSSPFPTQYSNIVVVYSPSQTDHYISEFSLNSPLSVLNAKDTIVGSTQYRILELCGDILLTHFNNQNEISIDNFHARIAFSL